MAGSRFRDVFARGRKRLKLTQAEIGRAIGISGRSVWHWENKGGLPDRDHLRKLVRFVDARDAKLGDEMIAAFGETRDALELQSAGSFAAASTLSPTHLELVVEGLISTTASALDLPTKPVRAATLAFLEKLREANIPLATIIAVLRKDANQGSPMLSARRAKEELAAT